MKDVKDDPYPTRSLVKRSISRRGVPPPERSWSEASTRGRAPRLGSKDLHLDRRARIRPISRQRQPRLTLHLHRPSNGRRRRLANGATSNRRGHPRGRNYPSRALVLDGVSGPPSPKKTNACSDKAPTPTLYSDESDDAPTSPSKRQPNSEDRHHDPEADGFTAIDGPRTPCPFKIQVQHGCEDAVELDDLGLSEELRLRR